MHTIYLHSWCVQIKLQSQHTMAGDYSFICFFFFLKYSRASFLPLHRSGLSSLTEHVSLKLQQLPHESQVRGDDVTPLLHKVEGLIQFDALRVHEVGQADGRWAGDTGLTMYQYPTTTLFHRVCGRTKGIERARDQHTSFLRTQLSEDNPTRSKEHKTERNSLVLHNSSVLQSADYS